MSQDGGSGVKSRLSPQGLPQVRAREGAQMLVAVWYPTVNHSCQLRVEPCVQASGWCVRLLIRSSPVAASVREGALDVLPSDGQVSAIPFPAYCMRMPTPRRSSPL